MFIEQNSHIDVTVHYKKTKHMYVCIGQSEFGKIEDEDEKKKYNSLNLKMKLLSWGLHNKMNEEAIEIDDFGTKKFNMIKYKEIMLKNLILSWDATKINPVTKQKEAVKVNEKNIKSLAPSIAETIINEYDDQIYMTEEEEKK